jgi:hypothetical protein
MDIKELQDLPEYDYDYVKMFFLKTSLPNYFYNNNSIIDNISNYINKRYFPNDNVNYDNKLFEIYKELLSFYYELDIKYIRENFIFKDLDKLLMKYNIGINFLRYLTDNLLVIKKNIKNSLILTSSDIEIKNFLGFKCDIIYCKQQLNYNLIYNNISKLNKHIKKGFTTTDLLNNISSTAKYDNIYINNSYINYDYLISSIYLQIKLPYFINLLLIPLRALNNNGNMLVRIFDGNKFKLPIMKKIFSIIVTLFDTYEILLYSLNNIIILKFNNFNERKYRKNQTYIISIINSIAKYENLEYNLSEMSDLLLTNKFYYKLNNKLNNNELTNTAHPHYKNFKHILTDIKLNPELYNIIDKVKSNDFINEYNNKVNYNTNLFIELYKEITLQKDNNILVDKIKLNNIITQYFDIRIIIFLNLMKENNLIDLDDIFISKNISKILKKYNINKYYRDNLLEIKNSR